MLPSTSRRPSSPTHAATASTHASGSPRSARRIARGAGALPWVASRPAWSTSTANTEAPSAARRSATLRPIPEPAPVTSATLPPNRCESLVATIRSAQDVLVGNGRPRPLPVQVEGPRRQGVDLALRVLVVAVLDRRVRPDELVDLRAVPLDVLVVGVLAYLDRPRARRQDLVDAVHRVVDLAFRMEEQARAVRQVGARPVHAEEVGEVRDRDAEVRRRFVTELLTERDAVAPGHVHRREEVVVLEAGRVADDVGLVQHAVGGDDAFGNDTLDRRVLELDVRLLQRAQPRAVVLQDPLPHRGVVGDRLRDQVGPVLQMHRDPRGELPAPLLVRLVDRDAVGTAG